MPGVLYVDDDHASRDILVRLLKHHNIDVDVAENATQALMQARQQSYDLFVIDLALPDMDGWELFEELKSSITGNWKAAALTAYYDANVAKQAKVVGFEGCFAKPASIETAQKFQSLLSA